MAATAIDGPMSVICFKFCNKITVPSMVPNIPINIETSPITFRQRATELASEMGTSFAPPRVYVQQRPYERQEVADIPKKMATGKIINKDGRSRK
jgi:hypothetical protein